MELTATSVVTVLLTLETMTDPLKPELLLEPVIVRDPRVTATAPTFRTTRVSFGVPASAAAPQVVPKVALPEEGPMTNVAISIAMLDCAAWF